jgi:hypothetical protein
LWKAAEEAGRWAGIFENLNNLQFFQRTFSSVFFSPKVFKQPLNNWKFS